MLVNVGVSISFIIMLFIVVSAFLLKQRINKIENEIFKKLLWLTIFGLVIECVIYFLIITNSTINKQIYTILTKVLYVYYVFWMYNFVSYNFCLFYNIKSKHDKIYHKFKIFMYFFYGVATILSIILPIKIQITSLYFYPLGIGTFFQYLSVAIGFCIIIICSFKNIKMLKTKEAIPLIVCFSLGIISSIIQYIYHEFMFIIPSHAIAVILMYFTIENPDLKMLEEYIKNKKITELSIEDKANMLFKISQETKSPANRIEILSNKILNTNDIMKIHTDATNINLLSRDISNTINNVLNISTLDIKNVKCMNDTYNIYNLFNHIILLTRKKIANNIQFKYSLSQSIPEMLCGDSLKIKQIVYSIIMYAIKNTKSGYIDLDVSALIKYDVCRLLINISYTGNEMSMDKINQILDSDIEEIELEKVKDLYVSLYLVKKIIDVMGGTLLIKSEERIGAVFTIILNQKIDKQIALSDNSSMEEISNFILSNKKRILLIDDDYQELQLLTKELKINNFEVTSTMYGKDCITILKDGQKFDYIIIDDEMNPDNAVEILKEIDTIKEKIIIMLGKEKESIKEHYLQDYPFIDYLLKSVYKEEIKRIFKNKND